MTMIADAPTGTMEMTFTPDQYKLAFRLHPGGVALITAETPSGPIAITASSVASVSAEPPILMFSVSVMTSAAAALRKADTVVVHLLSADNLSLAELGAARGVDRFADTSIWSELPTGEPVFTAARAWIRARVLHRIDAGGSTVVVAEAIESSVTDDHLDEYGGAEGLVYFNRAWHRIGDGSRIGR